jgi:hypothetical protein
VINLQKLQTPPTSNPPEEQVRASVWIALGNDYNELLYGIRVEDPQRLPHTIEWDLYIDALGKLNYTHRWHDFSPEEDIED